MWNPFFFFLFYFKYLPICFLFLHIINYFKLNRINIISQVDDTGCFDFSTMISSLSLQLIRSYVKKALSKHHKNKPLSGGRVLIISTSITSIEANLLTNKIILSSRGFFFFFFEFAKDNSSTKWNRKPILTVLHLNKQTKKKNYILNRFINMINQIDIFFFLARH